MSLHRALLLVALVIACVGWDNCGAARMGVSKAAATSNSPSRITVSLPASGSTVASPAHFTAAASTSCAQGVASIAVYAVANHLSYQVNSGQLDTDITLPPGNYNATLQESDNCGGTSTTTVNFTVSSAQAGSSATAPGSSASPPSFSNLQASGGWTGYAELPPNFDICQSCTPSGPQVTWSMGQGVSSPSLSGKATQFSIGGTSAYSDVLWNNHLIGELSSQGKPDTSLVPTLSNFVYDVYFYGTDLEASQSLEFDINQFFGGMGFIWGHECRIQGGHVWAVWDNVNSAWVVTGIPCNPQSGSWNHLTIQVQRTSDNRLHYQSITLNGQTSTVDRYFAPGSASGWNGITINYQMDGNSTQQPYSVWLDQLTFQYW